ncbi:MAG: transposase [Phycisphaerales bacterium]
MSESNRHHWTAEDKLRLVLEALQSEQKVAELCRREGVSPTQIYEWRKQLMGSAKEIFADKRGQRKGEDPRIVKQAAELQRMKDVIAEITAENLVLKKTLSD